ncbi:MAG TPA: chemotaxis response regulator protein-glutamate methylesterase [Hyphomicrobium sp.]|nr:chemotaxis response regulator protein-glutamate methylesterase [Hyphomicrobium sp.]
MKAIRVLVVDDSATMRHMIKATLARDPGIEVIGEAEDPLIARQAIKQLNPDVVTLDVEMPNMNGLEFLEKIMRLRPMPVVMVSTLTRQGAEATIQALEMGAVDYLEKPSPDNPHKFEGLASKIKIAAHAQVKPLTAPRTVTLENKHSSYVSDGSVVAIGASTGGVEALIAVISQFPQNCPPTVITQHMPVNFTKTFALRLDRLCAAEVREATDGAPLKQGTIYLAPGGDRHLEIVKGKGLSCRLRVADKVNGHCPSVDVLFNSIAQACGRQAVGAILTGMGKDGAAGLLNMRQAGAKTFGQNEASCVVYGMPRVAYEMGAVSAQLSLDTMAKAILESTSATKRQ